MKTAQRSLSDLLAKHGACSDARKWAEQYDTKPVTAWRECHRGDWLLWILGKFSGEPESEARKKLVLCACECARLAPPTKRADWEQARLHCLDVTERWARDEGPTIQEVRKVRDAAYAAASASAAASAASASAAASAASAAADAAYAAAAAADAAYAASAASAAADAARADTLDKSADIVRKHYKWKEVRGYLEV